MIEYRHLTNLQQPYSDTDQRFLDALEDYKVGQPVEAKRPPGEQVTPYKQLRENHIIGIYTTEAALKKPAVKKIIGWYGAAALKDLYKPLED